MWRPFTGSFVGHSYGSYVKKNGRGVEKPRVKAATLRSSDLKYLFPNNAPPQVVEERMKRFYDLRVKVDDQRVVVDVADGVAVGEPHPVPLPGHAVGDRDLALRPRGIAGDVVDEADLGAALVAGALEFSSGRHGEGI